MSWSKVGKWVKGNVGGGAKLVGSLLTGNIPDVISTGIGIVTGATGEDDPEKVLESLKSNPDAMVKLKELYVKEEDLVRQHIKEMKRIELEDEQISHNETQETIRQGDQSEHTFIRFNRPAMAWCGLLISAAYLFISSSPDLMLLSVFMSLPLSYFGLREVGKGIKEVQKNKLVQGISAIKSLRNLGK